MWTQGRAGLASGVVVTSRPQGWRERRAREGCFEWGDGSGHLQSPHREGTQRTPCSVPIAKSSKNWKARGLLNWSVAHLSQLGPGAQSRMETDIPTPRQGPGAATASDCKLRGLQQGQGMSGPRVRPAKSFGAAKALWVINSLTKYSKLLFKLIILCGPRMML